VASVVWLTASINQKTSNCGWINKRCELKKKKLFLTACRQIYTFQKSSLQS
jgi:hypothetical protein